MSNIWFETNRLVIRDFDQHLAAKVADYRNDLEWMKYQGFKGFSVEEYVKAILSLKHIESGIQLAMTDQEGNLVGDLYLKAIHQELRFGYTINKQYSRQGLTYEACKGLFKWAQLNDYKRLIAGVDPNNKASINLLIKLKMNKVSSSADEDIYQVELNSL